MIGAICTWRAVNRGLSQGWRRAICQGTRMGVVSLQKSRSPPAACTSTLPSTLCNHHQSAPNNTIVILSTLIFLSTFLTFCTDDSPCQEICHPIKIRDGVERTPATVASFERRLLKPTLSHHPQVNKTHPISIVETHKFALYLDHSSSLLIKFLHKHELKFCVPMEQSHYLQNKRFAPMVTVDGFRFSSSKTNTRPPADPRGIGWQGAFPWPGDFV